MKGILEKILGRGVDMSSQNVSTYHYKIPDSQGRCPVIVS